MPPASRIEIEGFELHRPLARGGFGEVWLGRDTLLGVWRAIKLVPLEGSPAPGTAGRTRGGEAVTRVIEGLELYARRLRTERAPAIPILTARIHPTGGVLYYVMPLADDLTRPLEQFPGEVPWTEYRPKTLEAVRGLDAKGRIDPVTLLKVAIRLAEALKELHSIGLAHGDIKPANIVFLGGNAVLADLDLVRSEEKGGGRYGTRGFAPPEGSGTATGDIHSLSVTLYVCLTGNRPSQFPILPRDWAESGRSEEARGLNRILIRGGATNPLERPKSASEMLEELRRLEQSAARNRLRRSRGLRDRWMVWPACGLLLILLIVVRSAWGGRQGAAAPRRTGAGSGAALGMATSLSREPEREFLRRQRSGDAAITLRVNGQQSVGIRTLRFSPGRTCLAVETFGSEVCLYDLKERRWAGVMTETDGLVGWLDEDRVVARYRVVEGRSEEVLVMGRNGERAPLDLDESLSSAKADLIAGVRMMLGAVASGDGIGAGNGPDVLLARHPDGRFEVSRMESDPDAVVVRSRSDGRVVRVLRGHGLGVTTAAWSDDGALLATGDRLDEVRIWEAGAQFEGSDLRGGLGKPGPMSALVGSGDGKRIALSVAGEETRIYRVDGLELERVIPGVGVPFLLEEGSLWGVRDGRTLVRVDPSTGGIRTEVAVLGPAARPVHRVLLSPDHRELLLFMDDGHLRVPFPPSRPDSGINVTMARVNWTWPAAWTPDGLEVLVGGVRGLKTYDARSGAVVARWSPGVLIRSLGFDELGNVLAGVPDGYLRARGRASVGFEWIRLSGSLDTSVLVTLPMRDRVIVGGPACSLAFVRGGDGQLLSIVPHHRFADAHPDRYLRNLIRVGSDELVGVTSLGELAVWRWAPVPVVERKAAEDGDGP